MTVNGLKLPDAFVALIDRPEPIVWWNPKGGDERWIFRGGEGGFYWVPEGTHDHHDYLDVLQLIASVETIIEKTNLLPWAFFVDDYTPEEIAEWNADYDHVAGFIPFITDFSGIIQFGYAGDGAAYCFDYRENADEPSVIHWNDAYWRRMAPNFQTFIGWFEPHNLDRARREFIRGTDMAGLLRSLQEIEQTLTSTELPEARRADLENWATVFRQVIEEQTPEGEDPGGDRSAQG